jgi:hypothetical protein
MSDNYPRPEINDVEALLRGLKPAAGGLDRDHVLFRAGRASARGPGRIVWPALSGVLGLVAAALAVALAVRPEAAERIVYVKVIQPAPAAPPKEPDRPGAADELLPPPSAPAERMFVSSGGRPLLERQLLRWGLDALPAPAPAPTGPVHRVTGVTVEPPAVAGPSWLHLFSFDGKGQ